MSFDSKLLRKIEAAFRDIEEIKQKHQELVQDMRMAIVASQERMDRLAAKDDAIAAQIHNSMVATLRASQDAMQQQLAAGMRSCARICVAEELRNMGAGGNHSVVCSLLEPGSGATAMDAD